MLFLMDLNLKFKGRYKSSTNKLYNDESGVNFFYLMKTTIY